ncbi:MAG: cytochrome c family protein [Gammaproteobacteria bacterium]|jgi:cytochrome c|nr:cytochrome c family protein [Gammaproteobacteria bacterium]MDP6616318.1 cytochrome c family protein [Gammaproteobacteria bacterium]MDP6694032.1 cytochrome c family protein [Gammaproteobacteria bacterium]
MKRFLILLAPCVLIACAQDSADGGKQARPAPADAKAGERTYLLCQSCHTLNEGGLNKVGPNLYGFYGSPAAQADGFIFSEALSDAGISWDEETLDRWLTNPSTTVPGTTMIFVGISDQQQRADLIAYLRSATAEVP